MTAAEIRKQIFGVSDIDAMFLRKINELAFQQTKMLTMRNIK